MQRSLAATDVNFLSLQSAIFCVQCELLSENNTPQCLACGSGAVLSLSRVLGGSLRGQQTAHLIADAELDRLVRSLLIAIVSGLAIMDRLPCRTSSSTPEKLTSSRAPASSRKRRPHKPLRPE